MQSLSLSLSVSLSLSDFRNSRRVLPFLLECGGGDLGCRVQGSNLELPVSSSASLEPDASSTGRARANESGRIT